MHRLRVTPELVADTAELYGQNVTNALLDPDTYLDDYDWCRKFCGQHRHLSACGLALTSAEFGRAQAPTGCAKCGRGKHDLWANPRVSLRTGGYHCSHECHRGGTVTWGSEPCCDQAKGYQGPDESHQFVPQPISRPHEDGYTSSERK